MNMAPRKIYPKLHFKGEDYVDAVFINGEFRYAWLPSTPNMRDLIALQARWRMRTIDGERLKKKRR